MAENSPTKNTNLHIFDLPTDMMMVEIVPRLPLNAIFSCSCVCKENLMMLDSSCKPPLASQSLAANKELQFGTSCDKLVSLCDRITGAPIRVVWNSDLKKIVYNFPEITLKSPSRGASGLGFVRKTNEYKAIWVQANSWEAEILTLGENNWRRIGKLPCKLDCNHHLSAGTFLGGALHWVVKEHDSELIFVIDVKTEKFSYLSAPPGFKLSDDGNPYHWSNLGVLKGCLYICASDSCLLSPNIEVWMMKDYGIKESWSKALKIKNPTMEWWNPYRVFKLEEYNEENGELVLLCANLCRLTYKVDSPQDVLDCSRYEEFYLPD